MFRSYSNWIFMFILVLVVTQNLTHANYNGFSDISRDLPQQTDLIVYMESLHQIIKFCSESKHELDLNFEFGLFLTNVNLKSVFMKKKDHLTKLQQMYLNKLLSENDQLVDYFHSMVRENHDSQENGEKMIISLFSNEPQWMSKLPAFNMTVMSEDRLVVKPSSWSEYIRAVDDLDNSVPNPQFSDMCMISLATNEVHDSEHSRCQIYEQCYDMLLDGNDYGYAMSHRLLFLLIARYSRGCSIFSPSQDREMVKEMCDMSFVEAEYIADHSFGIVDLILEQMILCSLDGHPQFLQRQWLSNILRFQTAYGCFGQSPAERGSSIETKLLRSPKAWKMNKRMDHAIMGGLCNGHVTSVAAATLSAAVKYILEVYY